MIYNKNRKKAFFCGHDIFDTKFPIHETPYFNTRDAILQYMGQRITKHLSPSFTFLDIILPIKNRKYILVSLKNALDAISNFIRIFSYKANKFLFVLHTKFDLGCYIAHSDEIEGHSDNIAHAVCVRQ